MFYRNLITRIREHEIEKTRKKQKNIFFVNVKCFFNLKEVSKRFAKKKSNCYNISHWCIILVYYSCYEGGPKNLLESIISRSFLSVCALRPVLRGLEK